MSTTSPMPHARIRTALTWVVVTVTFAATVALFAPAPPGTGFDVVLVRLCSWALIASLGWLWVMTTLILAVACRSPQAAGSLSIAPRWTRRLVLLACGVTLTTSLSGPALAESEDHSGRVMTSLPPSATTSAPRAGDGHDEAVRVRVRSGDSLWSLAASRLDPGATTTDVATAWRRIYARNHAAIGPDPDRIIPGQVLTMPTTLD